MAERRGGTGELIPRTLSTATVAFTTTNFTQLIASLPEARVLMGIMWLGGVNASAGSLYTLDIAVGAAGSEVVQHSFREPSSGTAVGKPHQPRSLVILPAGARLSARSTASVGDVVVYLGAL